MRRALVLLVVLAATSAAPETVVGAGTAQASFAFGRTGGNIEPFTVTIARDGSVTTKGPVHPLRLRLSAPVLAHLTSVATAQHFFTLRRQTVCPGTLPDFAFSFVTVRTASASRTVLVRGDCRPAFTKVYAALSGAVGVR